MLWTDVHALLPDRLELIAYLSAILIETVLLLGFTIVRHHNAEARMSQTLERGLDAQAVVSSDPQRNASIHMAWESLDADMSMGSQNHIVDALGSQVQSIESGDDFDACEIVYTIALAGQYIKQFDGDNDVEIRETLAQLSTLTIDNALIQRALDVTGLTP